MSREERRAYQRMTRKQDPYALPSSGPARARLQRQERLKARRAATSTAAPGAISGRFWAWTLGGGAVIGLIAFSLAWPSGMPFAGYVGGGVALAWVAAAFGLRALAGRNAARR
jgi:hypothetical protein